ncbi:hypothetical protein CC1G_00638 [Coprinopsis cinerea okayama7|uniref:Uncharacterized protein n=1 Tax=Coprinopsis cinerea (strain Okayama-7 / 130 / ATCC MYA-4618 / FGSC 9003) TaxID=240176 RepID=A8N3L9_COPC7|nr:hypothetical protein CC1G_00638 [Coprinopsis cinerea okayama7\|eukprot:XP_001829459.1 hypothetical protein CC1G_00638 [Coprinopsis cinerea okayama7\
MVENPLAQHIPAVKVGGRRHSAAARPKALPKEDTADKTPTVNKGEGEEGAREESDEDDAPKKKRDHNDKKVKEYAHSKAESTRPTRDVMNNFKSFTGQRISQPAGKGLGL